MEKTRSSRRLAIDLSQLALIFDNRDQGYAHFLDLESGQIISISEDSQHELEEIYDDLGDDQISQSELAAALQQLDIQEWQREELLTAHQVESCIDGRYLPIPTIESRSGYRDMVDFIETIENPRLKTRLENAIAGKGAFRTFKDTLIDYPKERQRWFDFKEAHMQERAIHWLADEGIELLDQVD